MTIGDSVTSIGAFFCIAVLPDSVTGIGDGAFQSCSALQSVTIPDSVTSIGAYAFFYCSALQCMTIGDSVTSIGEWAFHSMLCIAECDYVILTYW